MNTSLKALFRRLWHQRLFTSLHILGLAIGISSCWVIYRIVSYEFSFENKLPNKSNIYRLVSGYVFDEKESFNSGVSAPIPHAVREQVTGIKRVAPVFGQWINSAEVKRPDGKSFSVEDPKGVTAVDDAYFDMIPYTWLAGNQTMALKDPSSVVLTESRARNYFPGLTPMDMLGRTVTYNDSLHKTVTGIVKDLDYPTEFINKEFVVNIKKEYPLNEWTNTNSSDQMYMQIDNPADTGRVMTQIRAIVAQKEKEHLQGQKASFKWRRWVILLPLTESHFSTWLNEPDVHKASKPVLYGLIGIAGFLLLLACINYINLSTAQVPQRAKEIGVRKTLGSSRWALIRQLLGETLVTVLLATALSIGLSKLAFIFLGDLIPEGALDFSNGLMPVLFITLLLIAATLLSGWYPARLIAKVQAISIMRGQGVWTAGHNRNMLRKSLIVFQFVVAQLFIIGALISGSQLRYTLKKDLGFNKEAVVLVNVPWKLTWQETYKGKQFALAAEISKLSGVEQVSLGTAPMVNNYSSSQFAYTADDKQEPVRRQVFMKSVDTGYMGLYEIKLLAGRNLHASDTTNEYVINETAMRAFGFATPQEAVGKMLERNNARLPIVGVVKDFHLRDFHTSIDPMTLMSNKRNLGNINIKLRGTDPAQWQRTLKIIEQKWYSFYPPETFTCKFYDETVEAMYKTERDMSRLISLATAIAIVISCLGLFGLVTLTAFQRTKEIGIRKVLGASVTGIVRLLSSEFVMLVVIALVIATPIAWWAMDKWLQDFVYRISIQWWMFGLTGLAAITVALLTVSIQAIKAALTNPVKSLRSE